ncbi:MAG: hypothetical protein C3F13_04770 [Anaerolineales bacterium]|nr:MAG: hypothetical protein C3F13_04770 [Anaerolineales bacterium]
MIEYRRLSTPRTAAVAGILFGLLFGASLILMRSAIPAVISTDISWATTNAWRINAALVLMPLASIAYLWFIGVVRDKLGEFEDKFFSTVFFGSSLLFLAMVFVSTAIAGGILTTYTMVTGETPDYLVIIFGRALMLHISNVYALRMAGVTMISLGTIWLRTGLMPRWLAWVTYILAVALLVVINYSPWITLIFPAWVLLISLFILWFRLQHPDERILPSV